MLARGAAFAGGQVDFPFADRRRFQGETQTTLAFAPLPRTTSA
jgi:hypothetical protein